MKCEQVRELLDDYHYDELEAGPAAEVAEHVQACAACRRELQLLERETRMFDAYGAKTAGTIDLSPDLWQRALARAAAQNPYAARAEQHGSWLTRMMPLAWMRQAVAALVLIGLSVGGTLWVVNYNRRDFGIAVRQPDTPPNAKTLDAALQSIQKAEQEYLKAIRDLNDVVEKRKSTLDPSIIAELQVSLRLIDNHIAATRKAYYAHPDDTELALHMLAAYSRKVELLQDLTAS